MAVMETVRRARSKAIDEVIKAIPGSCLDDYYSLNELKPQDMILEFSTTVDGTLDDSDIRIILMRHLHELCVPFHVEVNAMTPVLWKQLYEMVGEINTDFANRNILDDE